MFNHSFFNKPVKNSNDLPILKKALKYMTKKLLKYFFSQNIIDYRLFYRHYSM